MLMLLFDITIVNTRWRASPGIRMKEVSVLFEGGRAAGDPERGMHLTALRA
jgi:hypothetical protein